MGFTEEARGNNVPKVSRGLCTFGDNPPNIILPFIILPNNQAKMDDSFKIPRKSKKRSAEDTSSSAEAGFVPSSASADGPGGKSNKKAKKATKSKASKAAGSSKKKSAASSGPSAVDVSKLLHWLSRDRLESLITTSVTSKSALTESDLKNALPADAQWRFSSASSPGIIKSKSKSDGGPVKAGRERVNTGLFDGLDTVIMSNILQSLNVKERYLCCTAVAKSWRGFKTGIPGLFVDLSDDSFQHTEVVSGYSGERPMGLYCIYSISLFDVCTPPCFMNSTYVFISAVVVCAPSLLTYILFTSHIYYRQGSTPTPRPRI